MTFETKDGKTWTLDDKRKEEYAKAYPGLDLELELDKARLWLESNPSRRKTQRGMPRFLTNWLSKASTRGGSALPTAPGNSNTTSIRWLTGHVCPTCGCSDRILREPESRPDSLAGKLVCLNVRAHEAPVVFAD